MITVPPTVNEFVTNYVCLSAMSVELCPNTTTILTNNVDKIILSDIYEQYTNRGIFFLVANFLALFSRWYISMPSHERKAYRSR